MVPTMRVDGSSSNSCLYLSCSDRGARKDEEDVGGLRDSEVALNEFGPCCGATVATAILPRADRVAAG